MNPYIEKLKAYLAVRPAVASVNNMESLMEFICYQYIMSTAADNDIIHSHFIQVSSILQKLPLAENDAVSNRICDLCTEYSRRGFMEGMRTGAQLVMELLEL